MITAAIDLTIWTVLFFVVGMYKPQWPLFFLKKPDRFLIVVITTVLIMITATLYGQGLKDKREKEALEATPAATQSTVPVPVPVPTPETPAAKN